MSRIRSVHQLDGLITLDNKKCIAIFSDFDSAVLFRQHHSDWEVHIHLVIPRTSHSREFVTPAGEAEGQVGQGEKRPLDHQPITVTSVLDTQRNACASAYLTDGEAVYNQAIFTPEALGLANTHAQDETERLLWWETQYEIVHDAILNGEMLA